MDPTNGLWEMDRGELRIRREIARAEQARRRWRLRATAGGVILAVVLIAGGIVAAAFASTGPTRAAVVDPLPAPTLAAPAEAASVTSEPDPVVPSAGAETTGSQPAAPSMSERPPAADAPQRITIRSGGSGYEPSEPQASADRPIVLVVGKGEGCAAGFYMPSLGIEADNSGGPVTLDLGTLEPGSYMFTCGMGMLGGELIVR